MVSGPVKGKNMNKRTKQIISVILNIRNIVDCF